MCYVNTTCEAGIHYGIGSGEYPSGPIVGYVDSDWGGDPDTYHSRGGWLFTAWGVPTSWASYKIRSMSRSSCEAEYQSAAQAVQQATWLRHLFSDLGYGDLRPDTYGSLCEEDFVKERLSGLVDRNERPITLTHRRYLADSKNGYSSWVLFWVGMAGGGS